MKHLFTMLAFVALSTGLMAQSGNVIAAFNSFTAYEQSGGSEKKTLEEGYEMINKATVHEVTKTDPKTWWYKAYISLLMNEDKELFAKYPEVIFEAAEALSKAIELAMVPEAKKFRYLEDVQDKSGLITVILYNRGVESAQKNKETDAYRSFKACYEISMLMNAKGFAAKNKLPEVKEAKYFNALFASRLGKTDEAQKLFDELINEGYNSANLYQGLAMMQKDAGKKDEAIATLQKGMKQFPTELGLVIDMINIYLESGRETEAIDAMIKAIELDPTNHQLYFVTGVAYGKIKNYDKAIEYYNKGIAIKPDYADAYNNIGAVYLELANEEINKMGDPKTTDAQYKQYDTKRLEYLGKALPALEKADALNPGNLETMDVLRTLYAKLGDVDKSNAMKEKIKQLKEQKK